jgi:hypothetical protein
MLAVNALHGFGKRLFDEFVPIAVIRSHFS